MSIPTLNRILLTILIRIALRQTHELQKSFNKLKKNISEKSSAELIKMITIIENKFFYKNKLERFERLNKMNNSLQKDDSIKNKMKIHFDKLEEDRQEIEKLVDLRCILFIFFVFFFMKKLIFYLFYFYLSE